MKKLLVVIALLSPLYLLSQIQIGTSIETTSKELLDYKGSVGAYAELATMIADIGQIAYVIEEATAYQFNGSEWNPVSGESFWHPFTEESEYFDEGLEYSSNSDTSDFIAKVDRIGFEYNDDTLIIDNSGDIRLFSSGSHTILGKTSYDGLGSWWNTAIGANVGRNSLLVTDNTIIGANSVRTSSEYTPAEINGCTLIGYNNYWTQGGGQLETCFGFGQYNMNRLRDGINNMWLGQGIYQDPMTTRMDLNNRFLLGMPATDDGANPMLDSTNVLLFGRFSPARRTNQFLRINGNLQVEQLGVGQVPYITTNNQFKTSSLLTWDEDYGLFVGKPIETNTHINFLAGGDILTINGSSFIKIFGTYNSCSSLGYGSGLGSFGVHAAWTNNFGSKNLRNVVSATALNAFGSYNFYAGAANREYTLSYGNVFGYFNFSFPVSDSTDIEYSDFNVLGNNSGGSAEDESENFTIIGNDSWTGDYDFTAVDLSNQTWITSRGFGEVNPTDSITHVVLNGEAKTIDLYAENGVTVNGDPISVAGNQFTNIGDTVLQTMASLAIGCSNIDSSEQTKIVGDLVVVGTGTFQHLEVIDGIDIESSDSLNFNATHFNVADGLMVGSDTVFTHGDTVSTLATLYDISLKSNIASPTFTGTVTAPTLVTTDPISQLYGGTGNWIENEFFSTSTNVVGVVVSVGTSSFSSNTNSVGNHPGIVYIRSHASNANSGCTYNQYMNGIKIGDIHRSTAYVLCDTSLLCLKIGFTNNYTAVDIPTTGCYFYKPTNTVLKSVVTTSTGVHTYGSSFQLVVGTWYTFYIEVLSSTTTRFWIKTDNGTIVYDNTITATVPTSTALHANHVMAWYDGTPGGATDLIDLDRLAYKANRTLTRPYDE
jgi:pSer/pThr/pTyr-binding forkhead associated (FHA) protein